MKPVELRRYVVSISILRDCTCVMSKDPQRSLILLIPACFPLVEMFPQLKIICFQNHKHWYRINTNQTKLRWDSCESDMNFFGWKVTWNYAYSSFKTFTWITRWMNSDLFNSSFLLPVPTLFTNILDTSLSTVYKCLLIALTLYFSQISCHVYIQGYPQRMRL